MAKLPGVGPALTAKLTELHVATCAELLALRPDRLAKAIGPAQEAAALSSLSTRLTDAIASVELQRNHSCGWQRGEHASGRDGGGHQGALRLQLAWRQSVIIDGIDSREEA